MEKAVLSFRALPAPRRLGSSEWRRAASPVATLAPMPDRASSSADSLTPTRDARSTSGWWKFRRSADHERASQYPDDSTATLLGWLSRVPSVSDEKATQTPPPPSSSPSVPNSATDVYRAQYRDLANNVAWATIGDAYDDAVEAAHAGMRVSGASPPSRVATATQASSPLHSPRMPLLHLSLAHDLRERPPPLAMDRLPLPLDSPHGSTSRSAFASPSLVWTPHGARMSSRRSQGVAAMSSRDRAALASGRSVSFGRSAFHSSSVRSARCASAFDATAATAESASAHHAADSYEA